MPIIIADSFVVGPTTGPTAEQYPPSHSRVLYQSIATESNVSASSSSPGFPANSAVIPLTYEQWRPDSLPATWTVETDIPRAVDAVGIYSPNIATVGAAVKIEYSFNGVDWVAVSEFAASNNNAILVTFDEVLAKFWRLNVSAQNGIPEFSAIYVGKALQMQRQVYGGLTPVTMARKTKYNNNRSDKGQFLGRSIIREGTAFNISWRHLTPDWYRNFFDPFAKRAREYPFFLSWYPEKYPSEVSYCWTTDDITPTNMGIGQGWMEVSMNVEGLQDD